MTLDKFGRHLSGKEEAVRGPKGEGFFLTPEGNYDMQHKKICNLARPSDDNDAVTLNVLKDFNSSNLILVNDKFDARKKAITNVGVPRHDLDAVNLRYVKNHFLTYLTDSKEFDAKSGRIINLSMPKNLHDAINCKYFFATLIDITYAIYHQFHKHNKNLLTKQQWAAKTWIGNVDWIEMFSFPETIVLADKKIADPSNQ